MTLELPAANTIIDNADCLHTEQEVHAAIDRMAAQITDAMSSSNPIVYTIMNGGLIVSGHLLPKLKFPLECSYLHASRYRHETSGGQINWLVPPRDDMKGRTILIIDDILDEGHTLAAVIEDCIKRGAKEVKVAVLVDKLHDRKAPGVSADFVGLEVEDRFLFGCGMDYQGYWRNTLCIYAVKGL